MQAVVEVADFGVATVNSEGVLGEVVGANAEKRRFGSELFGNERRGRGFDHDADFEVRVVVAPFGFEFDGLFGDLLFDPAQFFQADDHRDHHPQVAVGGGTDGSTDLAQEYFRVVFVEADAAPAEEGVFFFREVEVGQRFVAADVQ